MKERILHRDHHLPAVGFLLATIALVAVPLFFPREVRAQTKAEKSQYTKLMKKPSVKAADKFLGKFPASTYAQGVVRLRDSLLLLSVDHEDTGALRAFAASHPDTPFKEDILRIIRTHNTSDISGDEARAKATGALDAVGWKVDNRDGVAALYFTEGKIELRLLNPLGVETSVRGIPVYTASPEGLSPEILASPLEVVHMGSGEGRNYIHFAYLNSKEGTREREYVGVLYDPVLDLAASAMFYGKDLPRPEGEDMPYLIEGQCAEKIGGVVLTPEVSYLVEGISQDPRLVEISKGDLLTDEAIKWWRGKNPTAETTATSLVFGALDRESTLVGKYEASRKENAGLFRAAMFDYRDYTLIVAYSKKTDDYLLVWCEPVCVDRSRDKLLSTVYFEDDSTLDLFYYHGRRTFKIRVNLASKRVRR